MKKSWTNILSAVGTMRGVVNRYTGPLHPISGDPIIPKLHKEGTVFCILCNFSIVLGGGLN